MPRKRHATKIEPPAQSSPQRRISVLKPDFWPPAPKFKNFEWQRGYLNRRLKFLEDEVQRLKGTNRFKDRALADVADWLSEFLDGPHYTTHQELTRRISILKGAISRVRGGSQDES